MASERIQLQANKYIKTHLQAYADKHTMKIPECIRFILISFFDEYELKQNNQLGGVKDE